MIPTSSQLLVQVVAGLEASSGPPTFERLQAAVAYGEEAMPVINQAGLTSDTHNLTEVLRQTIELNLVFKVMDRYMLTEGGRDVLQSQSRPTN